MARPPVKRAKSTAAQNRGAREKQAQDDALERARVDAVWADHIASAKVFVPPSWPDSGKAPAQGAVCGCCRLAAFWHAPGGGWSCTTCHPPIGCERPRGTGWAP